MPRLSSQVLRNRLRGRQFTELFVEELGWDRLRNTPDVVLDVRGTTERLRPVAQKRSVPLYLHRASPLPDRTRRRAIEAALARQQREHLIVFADDATGAQVWQWVKREPGRPDRLREHAWRPDDDPEGLRQKLDALQFTLEEEDAGRIGPTDVTDRLRRAFDADEVTNLNHQLARSRQERGRDRFFAEVLCPLFFRGFALPEARRTPADRALLGTVPYLNGGLFQEHQIEREHGERIALPDKAFADLFAFFDGWRWHLDARRAGDSDVTERARIWRRWAADEWAADDTLPPVIRRRMQEHADDAWCVNALRLWRALRRRAGSARAERRLLQWLDECEALEREAFADAYCATTGLPLPHRSARATVQRAGARPGGDGLRQDD
jgi:hypothetical protein